MSSIRSIILFCMLLTAALAGWSQVRLHGKVTDMDNKPLEFVTVKIAGTALGTHTGLDGGYSLKCSESDTIVVVFSMVGYVEQRRTLVDASGDVALNMRMRPSNKELDELEVTEIRKQTGSMQTIDASAYRFAADATGGSVESMLATLGGVNSSNELSSQYSVRGGTYDENSVFINGVEVYRPLLVTSGQQEGLSVINPHLVGAVGFSTGGYGVEYGDRMSSALDITYRQPEAFEGSASLSLMGADLAIGQGSGRFSQLHGVRYKRNSSLLSSLETRGEYDPSFFDYQTNIGYKLSPRMKLSFLGNIALNHYKFTPADRETNFGTSTDAKRFKVYFDGHEKDRFETYFGALSLDYALSGKTGLTLLASGFLTNELVAYDITGEYWLDQAGTSGENGGGIGGELGVGRYHEHARNRLKASVAKLELKGVTNLSRNNTLSYGASLSREKVMERAREWELRDSAGFSLPSDGVNVQMISNLTSHHDIESSRMAAYVSDNIKLNASSGLWVLTGGVRLSYWDFNKELLVSPRLNVGFVPSSAPRWAFRFATGLYYQSPFYKEMRMPVADEYGNTIISLNKEIKSQRSVHFVFGSDYTFRAFNRPFKLSSEFYYKALGNLVAYELDNLKVVYTGVNGGNGFTTGVDFRLFGQFVPGSDSWLSFSLMKTQETLNGVKVPRPTDQRYSFTLYFTDFFPKIPKLKFSLRGIFSDGLPTTAPGSSRDKGYFRTPPYKRVDVGFSYALLSPPREGETRYGLSKALKSVWLGLDVFNLLDISNVSSYYWVTDVNNIKYAVPNYLTRRQLNVRVTVDF